MLCMLPSRPHPQHSCPQEFNNFLRSLKEEVIGTRYSPFWGLVTARPLTLITAAECPTSSVAEGEAKELLSGASHVTPQGAESVVEQQEDADDLVRPTAGSAPQWVQYVEGMGGGGQWVLVWRAGVGEDIGC